MTPTRRVTLRDDDAAYLATLVEEEESRILSAPASDGYTYDDKRQARFRRQRIHKVLHLEDKKP